jgi:hypothetical protein
MDGKGVNQVCGLLPGCPSAPNRRSRVMDLASSHSGPRTVFQLVQFCALGLEIKGGPQTALHVKGH